MMSLCVSMVNLHSTEGAAVSNDTNIFSYRDGDGGLDQRGDTFVGRYIKFIAS